MRKVKKYKVLPTMALINGLFYVDDEDENSYRKYLVAGWGWSKLNMTIYRDKWDIIIGEYEKENT